MQTIQRTPGLWIFTFALVLADLNGHTQASGTVATKFVDDTSGLTFVSIPAGKFTMGTTTLEAAATEMPKPDIVLIRDETPPHRIKFKQSFLLSSTEVTQAQWLKIMQTRPGPDKHWQHPQWQNLPVVSVSWNDTQSYIGKLNRMSDQYRYRLPTEAEWEYAARAGDSSLRPFSKLEMDEHAWYLLSSNDEVQAVAQLKANQWGLHDMMGNVWEWVADWYQADHYRDSAFVNPTGPNHGSKKVRRGGSYHCPPHLIRPGYRAADNPENAYSVLGFRLVAISK